MENKNLELYEEFRQVPKEAQKAFSNGKFSGTDINPMWRIKKLTEKFGPCGFGWRFEVTHREMKTDEDTHTTCAFIAGNLYVKLDGEWSAGIYGEGGNTFAKTNSKGNRDASDEAYKMAYTDALSNASKQLGLGADIWWENDRTKYTNTANESKQPTVVNNAATAPTPKATPAPKKEENKKTTVPPVTSAHEVRDISTMSKEELNEMVMKIRQFMEESALFKKDLCEHLGNPQMPFTKEQWMDAIKFYLMRNATANK